MKFLKGKKIADKILLRLKGEIKKRKLKLKLAIILVGDDPPSLVFIKQKQKICKIIGIVFELFKFPSKISFPDLKKEIEKISKNQKNSGVVIQLPFPKNLKDKEQQILNLVPPEKDIDVLSERNLGKFCSGTLPILPPVVGAVFSFLKEYKISIKRKNILLVGAGRLVGLPLTFWLLRKGATVSVVNKFTKNISYFTKKADILISGIGKSNFIKGRMIKRGVIIIDAGTSCAGRRTVGDIDFDSVSKKASYITSVPGGVGPLTVVCLVENLVRLNSDNNG